MAGAWFGANDKNAAGMPQTPIIAYPALRYVDVDLIGLGHCGNRHTRLATSCALNAAL